MLPRGQWPEEEGKESLDEVGLGPGPAVPTCSWMMWNWLMSSLAVSATMVLYDGNPAYSGPPALWELIEREKISVFGTSASYIHFLRGEGPPPCPVLPAGSEPQENPAGKRLLPPRTGGDHGRAGHPVHLQRQEGGEFRDQQRRRPPGFQPGLPDQSGIAGFLRGAAAATEGRVGR